MLGEDHIRAAMPGPDKDMRLLDEIQSMADRASVVNDRIFGFIARVRGMGGATESGQVAPVPSGYQGQMDRLNGLLVQLCNLADDLERIG